jgi:predicted benzoate:H+ symporter BenE
MTDKNSLADGVRERGAADSPHAHQEPDRRGWTAAIKHRWPTWLAIALAALTVGGSIVQSLADVLPMLAWAYLAGLSLFTEWPRMGFSATQETRGQSRGTGVVLPAPLKNTVTVLRFSALAPEASGS